MTGPDIAPALFERAKLGDKRAVDVVLAALRPALVSRAQDYLRKYPDDAATDAEDVAQAALLAIWQNLGTIESADNLLSFGLKAALNKAKDTRESNHRRRERIVVSSPLVDNAVEGTHDTEHGIPLGNGNYLTPKAGTSND